MFIGVTSTSKTQTDQLGDRLRKGEVSDEDVGLLESYRLSFEEAYEEVVACIQNATQLEPTGRRAKSTSSIIEKLRRETIRLSQMQDIAGCRLVVRDVLVQDKVVDQISRKLAKAVVIDRRKQPSYGYRAVHIIATARNRPIEIQVRTELQHLWAQLSEKLSDARGSAIKYGGGDPETRRLLSTLSRAVEDVEDLELDPDTIEVARVMKPLVRSLVELASAVQGGK
jgi:ppGpp synthetase/RelA/SpoT-type nucleotidyltranferase